MADVRCPNCGAEPADIGAEGGVLGCPDCGLAVDPGASEEPVELSEREEHGEAHDESTRPESNLELLEGEDSEEPIDEYLSRTRGIEVHRPDAE